MDTNKGNKGWTIPIVNYQTTLKLANCAGLATWWKTANKDILEGSMMTWLVEGTERHGRRNYLGWKTSLCGVAFWIQLSMHSSEQKVMEDTLVSKTNNCIVMIVCDMLWHLYLFCESLKMIIYLQYYFLEPFSYFPELQKLEIAVNGIRGIQLTTNNFPFLQVK